jgi:hypothetical protein
MQTTSVSTDVIDRKLLSGRPLADAEIAHLHSIDAVAQQAKQAAAGRAAGVAERNVSRGDAVRAGTAKVLLRMIDFGATPETLAAAAVQAFVMRNGPERYGLKRVPYASIIREEIKKLKEG